MDLEQNIQMWVKLDNQLKSINEQSKRLREQKHSISEQITSHVSSHNLSDSRVTLNDGQLRFCTIKETQTLTFKYLETCLHEIIKNDEQVAKIVEYVKGKREIKYVPEIKRLYNK